MNTENQDLPKSNALLGVAWGVYWFGVMLALLGIVIELRSETTPPYALYLVAAGLIICVGGWILSEFIMRKRRRQRG